MKKISAVIFCVLCFSLFAACGEQRETIDISINGHVFQVELAVTPEEKRRGLMLREELDEDSGMLFVYEADRRMSFWMKNTYIPLSVAFISADGEIREIHRMRPESLATVSSEYSVRYALEVNQGRFEELGISPGDYVEFPEGWEQSLP
ncbi:MAG: DUF192 domain-containing protein [Spirochaetia bacterium]